MCLNKIFSQEWKKYGSHRRIILNLYRKNLQSLFDILISLLSEDLGLSAFLIFIYGPSHSMTLFLAIRGEVVEETEINGLDCHCGMSSISLFSCLGLTKYNRHVNCRSQTCYTKINVQVIISPLL